MRSRSHVSVICFLSALSIICAVAAEENDHLIVPGQRVGPIRLEMTVADLYKIMGDPTQANVGAATGRFAADYIYGDVRVHCGDGQHVSTVYVYDPSFRTRQGAHVGDSELAVRAKMGAGRPAFTKEGSLDNYWYPGAVFFFVDGRVNRIQVFRPH